MHLFLRNLLVTLTRAEEGIENEGLRVGDQKLAWQRRYDAAKKAAEHTWRRQDSEEYFRKRDKKDAKKSKKKEKTQKVTPTRKKTGSLNRTVDLISPERGQSPDLRAKKRNHDDLDTDYSSDDDRVPSECDEHSKTVIKNKNKKIRITKQLLKGKKEETKNLRNELRELRDKSAKERNNLNKTIETIEAEKEAREKDLADKEINLKVKEKKVEEKGKTLAYKEKKLEAKGKNLMNKRGMISDAIMRKLTEEWSAGEDSETVKTSVESMVDEIFEDYNDTGDSVFNDQESGTGHSPCDTSQLEENEAEMSEDEKYWRKAERDFKTYGEPVKNNEEQLQEELLDQEDEEETDVVRRTPDGQVIIINYMKERNHDKNNCTGSGASDCDSRYCPPRGERGGGLPDGGSGGSRQEINDDKKRKHNPSVQLHYEKTEFMLNHVQSVSNSHVIFVCSILRIIKYVSIVILYEWLNYLKRTEDTLRKTIRTMLSNETTRVRTLDFKDKTVNTEPVIKEKTHRSREENRRADGSTSTEEIDGKAVIKEVQKNQTTTTFQPHQSVLRRRPSFSPTCSERRCLCLPGLCCIHALCRRISCNVISVNQHLVHIAKAQ